MNKVEVVEKCCFGGSESHLAFYENNLVITHCGNHLHCYDTVSRACTIQKLEYGSLTPFATVGLYQPSFDKNGVLMVCCWTKKSQGTSETTVLEMNPITFYIISKLELVGRAVSLDISHEGKTICVVLIRRKTVVLELWDREHSLKLAESIHESSSHKKFQVAFLTTSSTFVLLSTKKLEFYSYDLEGLALTKTIDAPNNITEFSCLTVSQEKLIVGTSNSHVLQCKESDGITFTLKVGEILFQKALNVDYTVLPVNRFETTRNFFFGVVGTYVIQWRIVANRIDWNSHVFYKIYPIAEIMWIGVSDTENNFVLTTKDGDLFESVIFKESELAPKLYEGEQFRLIASWHKSSVTEVGFVAHKPWIISFSKDGKIVCSNFVSRQIVFSFFDENLKTISAVSLQPFGNHCLFHTENQYCLAFISHSHLIPIFIKNLDNIIQCKFSTFGHLFICLCVTQIVLFNTLSLETIWTKGNLHNSATDSAVNFCRTDSTIYLMSTNEITAFNSKSGDIIWRWTQISVHIANNVVGPNGSVFILSVDNCVREIKNGEVVSTISFNQQQLSSINFSFVKDTVILGTVNGEILCFMNGDVIGAASNPVHSINWNKIEKINSCSDSPFFVTASSDSAVTLWILNNDPTWSDFYYATVPNIVSYPNDYIRNEKQKLDAKLQHLYELSQSREFILNSKVNDLDGEINAAKIKYATDTLMLDNTIDTLKTQITILSNESATIAKDITDKYELKLAEKGDEHSKQLERYVIKMDAMESKYKLLLNNFDERNEKEKEKFDQRLSELTTQIHSTEKLSGNEIKRLRKQIHQQEFEIERLKLVHETELKSVKQTSSHQMKLVKDSAKAERLRMEIEIEKLNDEILLLQYNKSKSAEDNMALQTKVDQVLNVATEKERNVKQKENELNKIVEVVKTLRTKLAKLTAEFEQTKFVFEEKLSLKQNEITKLQQAKETAEVESKKTKDMCVSLIKDNDAKTRSSEELTRKLKANQKLLSTQVLEMSHKDRQINLLKQQMVELKDLSFADQKDFKMKATTFYQNLDKFK